MCFNYLWDLGEKMIFFVKCYSNVYSKWESTTTRKNNVDVRHDLHFLLQINTNLK